MERVVSKGFPEEAMRGQTCKVRQQGTRRAEGKGLGKGKSRWRGWEMGMLGACPEEPRRLVQLEQREQEKSEKKEGTKLSSQESRRGAHWELYRTVPRWVDHPEARSCQLKAELGSVCLF